MRTGHLPGTERRGTLLIGMDDAFMHVVSQLTAWVGLPAGVLVSEAKYILSFRNYSEEISWRAARQASGGAGSRSISGEDNKNYHAKVFLFFFSVLGNLGPFRRGYEGSFTFIRVSMRVSRIHTLMYTLACSFSFTLFNLSFTVE